MNWTITTTLVRWTARLLLSSVEDCVDWEGLKAEELTDRVDDDVLAEALDWDEIDPYSKGRLDRDEDLAGPVDRLHHLSDDPGDIYLWVCESGEAADQIQRAVGEEFQREYGRHPKACHIMVADLEELRILEPADLRAWIDPKANGEGSSDRSDDAGQSTEVA